MISRHLGTEARGSFANTGPGQRLYRWDRCTRCARRLTGLLSAIRAVATNDMKRVTANAVADRPAETSAGATLASTREDATPTLLCASVRECHLTGDR